MKFPIPAFDFAHAFTSFDPNLTNPASGLKGALAYWVIVRVASQASASGASIIPQLGRASGWLGH